MEEITFDPAARHEFLTGFHKRKLQRAKHAQEAAEKRARAERIVERKKANFPISMARRNLLTLAGSYESSERQT